jgi:hypothetical protein
MGYHREVRVHTWGWRTHLQQLLTATAMHVVRLIAWLGASRWASAGGSLATWPSVHPIRVHARQCSARGELTQQSRS